MIVNGTPYGEISEDPNEPIPLSPQHLLTMRDSVTPDLEKVFDDDLSSYGKLRWRKVRLLADKFWSHWKYDYLSTLHSRNTWRKAHDDPKTDDIVLLREDSSRSHWLMGRIVVDITDQVGRVRKVKLICANARSNQVKTFCQAIHQLVKLI